MALISSSYYDGRFSEKNDIILPGQTFNSSSIKDFDQLRLYVSNLLSNRTYSIPANSDDKSSFSIFNRASDVTNSLSSYEVASNKITQDINSDKTFSNAINIIYDLVHNNNMSISASTNIDPNQLIASAAATIDANGPRNQNDIIPALSPYFTIVNYWNTGTSTDHRCNGACTGYCKGSCQNSNTNGTSGSSEPAQWTGSAGACGPCGGSACQASCKGDGCTSRCVIECSNSACKSVCYGTCKSGCVGCSSGCSGQVIGTIE